LVRACVAAARADGSPVLFAATPGRAAADLHKVRSLRSRRVDGLPLLPSPPDSLVLPEQASSTTPMVLLDRVTTRTDVDQVGVENIQATSTLAEHLASAGHRRIGLINEGEGIPTSDERTLGYRLGLGRAGVPWDPELITA